MRNKQFDGKWYKKPKKNGSNYTQHNNNSYKCALIKSQINETNHYSQKSSFSSLQKYK